MRRTRAARIEIEADQHGEGLIVTVRDNGHGIAPANAHRLFQPYFTTKKHGTGLGLFVTRRMLAAHGGTVDFASRPGEADHFRNTAAVSPCAWHLAKERWHEQAPYRGFPASLDTRRFPSGGCDSHRR